MQYISPFHHLPEDIVNTILSSPNQIKLIRKRLLAEIELSTTQTIEINGKELTKFDVISLFDNLNDSELLAIHLAIFQDKRLLHLLENGELPKPFDFTFAESLNEEKAIALISPYYKEIVANLLVKGFVQKDLPMFKAFFRGQNLLTDEDRFSLYELLSRKIKSFEVQLENLKTQINKPNFTLRKSDMNALHLKANVLILNELPDEFSQLREEIAYTMNNFGCALINHNKNEEALFFFEIAIVLTCSDHIKGFFLRNLAAAQDNKEILSGKTGWSSGNSDNKSSSISTWFILSIIIAVIRLIIAFVPKNNTPSYNSSLDYLKNFQDKQNIEYIENQIKIMDRVEGGYSQLADMSFNALVLNMKMGSRGDYVRATKVNTNSLKKGQNIFDSLFKSPSFKLNETQKGADKKRKKKKLKLVNMTEYDCILLLKAQDESDSSDYKTAQFFSVYIPAVDSFEVSLPHAKYDIEPFLGKKLMKRVIRKERDSIDKTNVFLRFKPPYYFAENPPNMITGLKNVKTAGINGTARFVLMQFGREIEEKTENIAFSR